MTDKTTRTASFRQTFSKVLRTYQAGGMTLPELLAHIDEELASGSAASDMRGMLRINEFLEPLPEHVLAAVQERLRQYARTPGDAPSRVPETRGRSVDPAPVEPASVKSTPAEPATVEPPSAEPAPIKAAPVEPAPIKPSLVESPPIEPAPIKPTPVEPPSVEPVPIKPAPVEPAPIKASLVEPASVEPAPPESSAPPVAAAPALIAPPAPSAPFSPSAPPVAAAPTPIARSAPSAPPEPPAPTVSSSPAPPAPFSPSEPAPSAPPVSSSPAPIAASIAIPSASPAPVSTPATLASTLATPVATPPSTTAPDLAAETPPRFAIGDWTQPPPPPRPSQSAQRLIACGLAAIALLACVAIYLNYSHTPTPPAARAISPSESPIVATSATTAAPTVAGASIVGASVIGASAPAASHQQPEAGSVIRDCRSCATMVVLPTGQFEQGASRTDRNSLPDEKPSRAVTISVAVAMARNDVTVDEFKEFAVGSGRNFSGCEVYDGRWQNRSEASWQHPGFKQEVSHPVTCISWDDAVAYAQWMSTRTGHHYRLPSASEWEYAARAGEAAATPWGGNDDNACLYANVADQSAEHRYPGWKVFPCNDRSVYTSPVGSYNSNAFGLNDMLGNVLVWVADCWYDTYAGAPTDGSARTTADCASHELRGASWFSTPNFVAAFHRNHFPTRYRTSSVGFRLVRDIDP